MAHSIIELDQLTSEAEKAIEKHERGTATVSTLDVDGDDTVQA
jgi:hypothetical protein